MPSCICCGGNSLNRTYANLLRCPNCGHICANTSLTDAEMEELYSDQYFKGEEYGDYIADKPVLQRNFGARIKNMLKHLGDLKQLSLFEVGCAYGFFLEVARPLFARVRGIDLSESIVSYGRTELGVDAAAGNFLEMPAESNQVDVVCLWDTIEHLRTPELFTAHAARLLRPGGYLFMTTGDIASLNAKWRRENWRLIHPPTHLHYFSPRSISELLQRQGFEIREISHVGFYRSVGNTFANLLRGKKKSRWFVRLSRLRMCYYLNLYDIMFVVACKKG